MANNESYCPANIAKVEEEDIYSLDKEILKKLTSAPKISKKKFEVNPLDLSFSLSAHSISSLESDESTSAPSVSFVSNQLMENYFNFNLESDSDSDI